MKDTILDFLEDNKNSSILNSDNNKSLLTEKQQKILNILKSEGLLYHDSFREKANIATIAINAYFEILEDLNLIEIIHKKDSNGRVKKYIALKNRT